MGAEVECERPMVTGAKMHVVCYYLYIYTSSVDEDLRPDLNS